MLSVCPRFLGSFFWGLGALVFRDLLVPVCDICAGVGFGSVFGPRSALVSGGFGGPFLRIRSGGSFRIVWPVCPRGPFFVSFSGWLAP